MSQNMIKIAIADDHQIIIQGIIGLLDDQKNIEIIGNANNGKMILELIKVKTPDIIFMDVDMPEMDGIEATKAIKKLYPEIKIIALTVYNEIGIISELKKAGISGYLLKNISKGELLTAIDKVMSGKTYYSGEVTETIWSNLSVKNPHVPENITEREIEILKLIAEGLSNSAIGEKLFISPRTVDTHRTNLMKKLEVNNVAGLVKFAIQNGLVD